MEEDEPQAVFDVNDDFKDAKSIEYLFEGTAEVVEIINY